MNRLKQFFWLHHSSWDDENHEIKRCYGCKSLHQTYEDNLLEMYKTQAINPAYSRAKQHTVYGKELSI